MFMCFGLCVFYSLCIVKGDPLEGPRILQTDPKTNTEEDRAAETDR